MYLLRTKNIRKCSKLFISYAKPHNAVSKDTVNRWLKLVLFYADVDRYKGLSTRAASVSSAKRSGTDTNDILKAAGWTSCKTFQKFYDKL